MATSELTKNKTLDMVYVAMFAVLIAVCSWISIPTVIPFSLQTFGVFVTVGVLGGKRGTLSVFIYLMLGVIGIPVFTGFRGGVGSLLGATGGYIIGFLFAAFVMWGMEIVLGKKTWVLALSMIAGLLVCYAFGTAWYMWIYADQTGRVGLWTVLGWCVIPFIVPDIIKIALALTVCKRLSGAIKSS